MLRLSGKSVGWSWRKTSSLGFLLPQKTPGEQNWMKFNTLSGVHNTALGRYNSICKPIMNEMKGELVIASWTRAPWHLAHCSSILSGNKSQVWFSCILRDHTCMLYGFALLCETNLEMVSLRWHLSVFSPPHLMPRKLVQGKVVTPRLPIIIFHSGWSWEFHVSHSTVAFLSSFCLSFACQRAQDSKKNLTSVM